MTGLKVTAHSALHEPRTGAIVSFNASLLSLEPAGWIPASNAYTPDDHCYRVDNDGTAIFFRWTPGMTSPKPAFSSNSRSRTLLYEEALPGKISVRTFKFDTSTQSSLSTLQHQPVAFTKRPFINCFFFSLFSYICRQP